MTESASGIFLSYASQDAAVAGRIGAALREAGLEVWFDQSELRGGDAWDQLIRRRIRECALFVPVISAHTQTRLEGYFRLEWKLAVERTHLMADGKAFLVPVVIDAIDERQAQVPESFRAVQWTYLPGGIVTPAFTARVAQLLLGSLALAPAPAPAPGTAGASGPSGAMAAAPARAAVPIPPIISASRSAWGRPVMPIALGLVSLAAVWLLIERFVHQGTRSPAAASVAAPLATPAAADTATTPSTRGPPAHSIAVLPFTNMSGDPKDDYFSDGLSEELLNTLAAVPGLQVAARTSSFSFKGKDEAVGDIARKLNVGAILEGSVRRDKAHVRISTELINAVTGFQLWSQTYDRDLKDALSLQTEIASSVITALKVKLLQADAHEAGIGGTDIPKAYDAYLRGEGLLRQPWTVKTNAEASAAFDEAIVLDPRYANAYVGRARADFASATHASMTAAESARLIDAALTAARKAAELAPTLGVAHSMIGTLLDGQQDFAGAAAEYEKGLALSPGDARVYGDSAPFLAFMGRFDEAVARARRAVELNPLDPLSHYILAYTYLWARRYPESIESYDRALQLDPALSGAPIGRGYANYFLGNYEAARAFCDSPTPGWTNYTCLALVYDKLGRRADAQAQLALLQKNYGELAEYQYAQIYAQWGDLPRALEALERAVVLRDGGLAFTKSDVLLDPLRREPRFKAVLAGLKFPD
jgi:TolB-like protein/tetratricopeptide (TPR) repeat protein